MTTPAPTNKILWIKKHWHLRENPFPSEAIARLGGDDMRENGLLFDPHVQEDKVQEAAEKFVLGAAYGGLKFGFLWSLGTGIHGDARGFGKSSLMQYTVQDVNKDWGRDVFLRTGLEESDAAEHPMCAVLASFDMANARSLNAVFFTATQYACRFRTADDQPTLAESVFKRLVDLVGSTDPSELRGAIERVQDQLRGRTLGAPVETFLTLLCEGDMAAVARHLENDVTEMKRTRSGALYLATFLLMVKAAGLKHVLLCCDQLEDFASTSTTKQKRTIEVERFRDYLLEIQPMSDMLSVVVTMHPRATQAIGDMWRLADLPSYDHDRAENQHRVVVLERISSTSKAKQLLAKYLERFRSGEAETDDLYPFTDEAVETIRARSDGKPRDILRRAHALIDRGATENWDLIDAVNALRVLDSFAEADEDDDLIYAVRSSTLSSPFSED
jgi:hypothetical protein